MSDNQQLDMGIKDTQPVERVDEFDFEPIKGYPMLNWRGKRPFTSTRYYPAQLKEVHGEEVDGWLNKIYWGDNLQVMGHLLKEYRGKVNLVYIDPPFDSKADYKKKISLKGQQVTNDQNTFEEKQYTDIWTNDEYLQFMYERLILIRELLADDGSIYLHCDNRKSHFLRCILEEIFGLDNFVNEIIWQRRSASANPSNRLDNVTDSIVLFSKSNSFNLNEMLVFDDEVKEYVEKNFTQDFNGRKFMFTPITRGASRGLRENLKYEYKGYTPPYGWMMSKKKLIELDESDRLHWNSKGKPWRRTFVDEYKGQPLKSLWTDVRVIHHMSNERLDYPTQKPETLLERIIKLSSNPGDIVFDCFMGSGTTQAVAMKLGRRFIGADINLGAIQITTKRLLGVAQELESQQQQGNLAVEEDEEPTTYYTGFEVYNVNHYDVFHNPAQAKDLLSEALELNPLEKTNLFDGERDGRLWKIMPVNRIATKADLSELIAGFDYKIFGKRQQEHPKKPVEHITLVCMGHDPDLKATLQQEVKPFELDIEVLDILRDRSDLQFKRDSEADIAIEGGYLVIKAFYPLNLLGKLSIQQENVEDWREMVESVMIDWNYDGAVLEPKTVDIPGKNDLVQGRYPVPDDAGTIRIKITDLLSESLEMEVPHA